MIKQRHNRFSHKYINFTTLMISCFVLLFLATPIEAKAKASTVEIVEINYEEAYIVIDPNENTKVYYSDSKETTWSEVEGSHDEKGYLILDISWISENTDYELTLKGSEADTIISCTLPAANKGLKVTYDKLDGMLLISEEENATTFEWRKSTSYHWNGPIIITQADDKGAAFQETLESLRENNGKIYVRTPQEKGTSSTDVGNRPSRQVLVTISKRATAPKVTVSTSRLTLTTRETMEYMITNIGGNPPSKLKWKDAQNNMLLSELAPEVLYSSSNTNPKDVTIAFRTAETEKNTYSNTSYLTIAAQRKAPTEIITSATSKTFSLQFPAASRTNVYEYCVQKPGTTFQEEKASWKSVSTNKAVTLKITSVPDGSTIRIRLRGVAASSTKELQLPSAYATYTATYLK